MIDNDANDNKNNKDEDINNNFEPVEYSDEEIEIESDSNDNVLCIQVRNNVQILECYPTHSQGYDAGGRL